MTKEGVMEYKGDGGGGDKKDSGLNIERQRIIVSPSFDDITWRHDDVTV